MATTDSPHAGLSLVRDGYPRTEPTAFECEHCGVRLDITADPSPGVDDFPHAPGCPHSDD